MIKVEVSNDNITNALHALINQVGNIEPALEDIGEYLIVSTRDRFKSKQSPSGSKWKDNSALTQLHKGRNDPLIGESGGRGGLLGSFSYNASSNKLEFGSNMVYAAAQQFGAKQGQFGRSKRNTPLPWGDIPAREFLGLSEKDETKVLDIISEHLLQV